MISDSDKSKFVNEKPAKLLLATNNLGKIKEFRLLLKKLPYKIISTSELGINFQVIENGNTFEENAYIKASAYSNKTGLVSLADDSGIEVDALNGRPGIFSARYGGSSLTDEDRVNLLLEEMKNISWEERKARFRSVIVVAWPDGKTITQEGILEGFLTFEPLGENGFGYDPILYLPKHEKTSAQLTITEKNSISHRAQATKKIVNILMREYTNEFKKIS